MSKQRPQHFFSTAFSAVNRPGTCLWCGQNTKLTYADLDAEVRLDSGLFCSMACAADFGENAARLGARLDAKTGRLVTTATGR